MNSPAQPAASAIKPAEDPSPVATAPPMLDDDLDLGDVKLRERQAEACSMEEGCQSCQ